MQDRGDSLSGAARAAWATPAAKALLAVSALFVAWGHAQVWRQGCDFLAFWTGARMALEGRAAAAYDFAAVIARQHAWGFPLGEVFLNPPAFLLAATPFGLLSYPAALAAWICATFAAFAGAVRWFPKAGYWPALAFPAGVLTAMAGQNGFLTAALMLGAMGLIPRRPWVGGALIGLMAIKPQLAVLAPIALLAGREGRAFLAAAVTAVAVTALSAAIFGWAAIAGFLKATAAAPGLFATPEVLPKVVSVMGVATAAGAPRALAAGLQLVAALFAAWAVWRVWSRTRDPLLRGAMLAAATPLATPYLQLYDLVFLALPTVVLGLRVGRADGPPWAAAGLAYLLPLAVFVVPGAPALTPLWCASLVAGLLRLRPEAEEAACA